MIFLTLFFLLFSISFVEGKRGTPFSFQFYCDNYPCPEGSYQNICPWASGKGPTKGLRTRSKAYSGGYLEAMCFSDNGYLQNTVIFHDLASCKKELDFIDNNLKCTNSPVHKVKPDSSGPGTRTFFNFNCVSNAIGFSNVLPATNCPNGSYRNFCPRCSNMGNILVCWCFDSSRKLHSPSYLTISRCKGRNIYASNGKLECRKNRHEYIP